MGRGLQLLGVTLVATAMLAYVPGFAAAAEPPGVVLTTDSSGQDDVSVTVADDGSFTGTVTVSNTSDTDYDITADGAGVTPTTCAIMVTPSEVPAHRTVVLTVKSSDCKVADGSATNLTFADHDNGTEAGILTLSLAAKEVGGVSLEDLLEPFATAGVLAMVPVLLVLLIGYRGLSRQKTTEDGDPVWLDAGEDGVQNAATEPVSWRTEVKGVPAGWTFKDSWASNLSIGVTVFIALFGSQGALDAIFGDAPDEAVARLVIAGAIAGLFVGLAPLILKTIGASSIPTVGGLIVAAYCTLVGVVGQILATTWIFKNADADQGPGFLGGYVIDDFDAASILCIVLVVFLLFYGFWTIRTLLHEAFPDLPPLKPTPVSNELVYAAALAARDGWTAEQIAEALERARAAARIAADQADAETEGTTTSQYAVTVRRLSELAAMQPTTQTSRTYAGIL